MEIKLEKIIELYSIRVAELEHEVIMLKAQLIELQEGMNEGEE